jgi:hypothetical protein
MSDAHVQRAPSKRQFNLWWALAISIVLHLVLVLFSGKIPAIRAEPLVVPEESVLRFTFNQPSDEPVEQESPPRGDVPFDVPEPQPQPSIDPTPPPVDPGLEAQVAVPPTQQSSPAPDPAEADTEAERAVENPLEDEQPPVEEPEPAATEFPEAAEGSTTKEPGERPTPEASSPQGSEFNLDRALHDFGRQLDRAREAVPPQPAGQGPPRNVFVPDPGEIATTGYGLGNLTFETADFDWSDYARSIYVEIWRAWHNRLLRLVNDFEKWSFQNREPLLDHWNQIVFVIERSGEVSQIMVETPSGCVPLDDSATQALEEVLLPPLPPDFPKQRETVHARFVASGEIRFMRPTLTRMKALNYF